MFTFTPPIVSANPAAYCPGYPSKLLDETVAAPSVAAVFHSVKSFTIPFTIGTGSM